MKLNFMNFCFLGAENWPNSNFRALKIDKKGNFELLPSLNLISRKIWETGISLDFHTVSFVCTFNNFSAFLILREINFGWFQDFENCLFNQFEGFEVCFLGISQLKMSKIPKNSNLRAAKMVKHGSFWGFKLTKLISRKIWVAEKSRNFHTLNNDDSEGFPFC